MSNENRHETALSLPKSRSGEDASAFGARLVRQAGAYAISRFRGAIGVQQKGRGNVVTEVDLAVERMVLEELAREFPDCGVLSEESPQVHSESEYLWIVDPLDGSKNFSQGLPIFAVNLALARRGEVVLAMTYDPSREELFAAVQGQGARLNSAPMHVGNKTRVHESLVGFDMGYDDQMARLLLEFLTSLWPGVQSLRNLGSSALGIAYAAAGRTDLYVHHLLSPWDFAPGILLVQEAGGVITERDGSPVSLSSRGVVVANPAVHADLLRLAAGHPWARAGLD